MLRRKWNLIRGRPQHRFPSLLHRKLGTLPLSPSTFGLKTIVPGKGASDIDIIAVHGLGANPEKTWTYKHDVPKSQIDAETSPSELGNNSTMWLKDLLPHHVPNARIMTFNYASDWLRDAPRESMRPLAARLLANIDDSRQEKEILGLPERPIVFIGHSFGGLVIEEALVIAKHDQVFHHLLKATCGVVFLGTPHRGTDIASWGDTLATCAAALGLGPDTGLLNILRKDSNRLREIFSNFAVLANEMGLDLTCFHELYPTQIKYRRGALQYMISAKLKVVDEFSATIDGYRHYALHADHCTMNKFECKDDANFRLVAYTIRDLVKKAPETTSKRFASPNNLPPHAEQRHFVVPHPQNKNYIPRPSVDKALQKLLDTYPQRDAHVRVALYGLGGSGKTQHALNFAYRKKESGSIFWINGATESTFEMSYDKIGKQVGLLSDDDSAAEGKISKIIREWFESPRSGEWTLLVDGVDDLSEPFLKYCDTILPNKRGTIIFTSANTNVIGKLVPLGFGMEVGPMSESTAEAMFRQMAGQPEISSEELMPLLELLGRLPLAIVHAAAFLRENHLSIRKYVETFKGSDDNMKRRLLCEPTHESSTSILRTWDINFRHIRSQDQRASKLLKLMSQLGQDVPRELLRSKRLKEFGLGDDIHFDRCMGLLISFALVVPIHSRSSYMLHPLVSLRTRQKIEDKLLFQRMAIKIVNDAFPDDPHSAECAIRCHELLPHAGAVLASTKSEITLRDVYLDLKRKVEAYQDFLINNHVNRWTDWGFIDHSNVRAEESK